MEPHNPKNKLYFKSLNKGENKSDINFCILIVSKCVLYANKKDTSKLASLN